MTFPIGWSYDAPLKMHDQVVHSNRRPFRGALGLLCGPVVKNPPCNAGDMGSIPGAGRFHMSQRN